MTTAKYTTSLPDLTDLGRGIYKAEAVDGNIVVQVYFSLYLFHKNREDKCYQLLGHYSHKNGYRLGKNQRARAELIERELKQKLLTQAQEIGWQRIEEKYYGMTFVFYTPPGA